VLNVPHSFTHPMRICTEFYTHRAALAHTDVALSLLVTCKHLPPPKLPQLHLTSLAASSASSLTIPIASTRATCSRTTVLTRLLPAKRTASHGVTAAADSRSMCRLEDRFTSRATCSSSESLPLLPPLLPLSLPPLLCTIHRCMREELVELRWSLNWRAPGGS